MALGSKNANVMCDIIIYVYYVYYWFLSSNCIELFWKMDSNFINEDWEDIERMNNECRAAALQIEELELILKVIGSFGNDGALLPDIESKQNDIFL